MFYRKPRTKPVVEQEEALNDEEFSFTIREEHLADDLALVVQLAVLSGYIEACEDYDIEIDPEVLQKYEELLALNDHGDE